ncbi:MAG: hypothetical protein FJ144_03280 [Deltaproteobacteria bacterium]|nr:hypothetical protein [Deltaproteobacteria bacterium]
MSALALIPVVLTNLSIESPSWVPGEGIADWAIWSIFAVDAATKAVAFGRGWLRKSSAWLDLAILALTFPAMPALLSELRLVRLTNLGRMARIMAVVRLVRLLVLAQRAGTGLRRILSPEAFAVLFVTAPPHRTDRSVAVAAEDRRVRRGDARGDQAARPGASRGAPRPPSRGGGALREHRSLVSADRCGRRRRRIRRRAAPEERTASIRETR